MTWEALNTLLADAPCGPLLQWPHLTKLVVFPVACAVRIDDLGVVGGFARITHHCAGGMEAS